MILNNIGFSFIVFIFLLFIKESRITSSFKSFAIEPTIEDATCDFTSAEYLNNENNCVKQTISEQRLTFICDYHKSDENEKEFNEEHFCFAYVDPGNGTLGNSHLVFRGAFGNRTQLRMNEQNIKKIVSSVHTPYVNKETRVICNCYMPNKDKKVIKRTATYIISKSNIENRYIVKGCNFNEKTFNNDDYFKNLFNIKPIEKKECAVSVQLQKKSNHVFLFCPEEYLIHEESCLDKVYKIKFNAKRNTNESFKTVIEPSNSNILETNKKSIQTFNNYYFILIAIDQLSENTSFVLSCSCVKKDDKDAITDRITLYEFVNLNDTEIKNLNITPDSESSNKNNSNNTNQTSNSSSKSYPINISIISILLGLFIQCLY